jgi:hypothetical protein
MLWQSWTGMLDSNSLASSLSTIGWSCAFEYGNDLGSANYILLLACFSTARLLVALWRLCLMLFLVAPFLGDCVVFLQQVFTMI